MNLTEIEALADAATQAHKQSVSLENFENYFYTVKPQTVKAMCQLLQQQHEAIYGGLKDHADGFGIETAVFRSALAAYEEFNK